MVYLNHATHYNQLNQGDIKMKSIRSREFNLKIENPTEDEIKINSLMKQAVEKMLDSLGEYGCDDVKPLDFQRRDGFIPHSFNHGGYGVHILRSLMQVDEKEYYKSFEYHFEIIKEENPKMDSETDEFQDLVYDSMQESNDDICYIEARVMFHGQDDESGLYSATLEIIERTSDAPYFRYADSCEEFYLEFKNASDLEKQLETTLKKAV